MTTVRDAVIGAEMMTAEGRTPRIDILSGIYYAQVKSLRAMHPLRMTLFIPRTTAKKPAVIYFPGGGFTSSDYEKFAEMRFALARAGFVVVAAEYRVIPNRFPAPVEDAKAAVRWVRAHADEYGVDPNRIAVVGDSAGGYITQMLGATNDETGWDKGDFTHVSSAVQAVVSLYGISDLLSIGEGFDETIQAIHKSPAVTESLLVNGPAFKTLPAPLCETPEAAHHASALYHVNGNEPPFLLMHGTDDPPCEPPAVQTHVRHPQSTRRRRGIRDGERRQARRPHLASGPRDRTRHNVAQNQTRRSARGTVRVAVTLNPIFFFFL